MAIHLLFINLLLVSIFESKINLNKVKDNFDINENNILDSVIIGSGPGGSIAD